VEAALKKDKFKKGERPPTPNLEWYQGKSVGDKPTQNLLSDLAKVEKPHLTFNELMSTPIDFPAYAMNRLNINNLTKADLVGPVYNLLKGTCKSCVELEYNMEECYKALNDQLDWNNPEGDQCPFDLSKPLPLIESKYKTSITKIKAAKYELKGIEDMVPTLWSPIKVAYDKHATLVTNVNVNEWYGYGHLEEIEVRRADQKLYKFMEDIDRRLLERRLMRSLEKFVGGREYGNDLSQNRRDLPKDIPLDRIEFLRYDTKGVKVRKGKMQTKRELTLEQTQQGVSDEVMNFKKDGYSSFQDKEKYEHVGPKVTRSQEGKRSQDDDKRLGLADDLKDAQDHIQIKLNEQAQV
ncbi:hypothetical protein Tco_1279343, partial [Tanacetum coccineum]